MTIIVRLPVEIRRILQLRGALAYWKRLQHAFPRGEPHPETRKIYNVFDLARARNKHSVSRTFPEFCSPLINSAGKRSEAVGTGNHNVRTPLESFPVFRGIQTGAEFRQICIAARGRGRVKQV